MAAKRVRVNRWRHVGAEAKISCQKDNVTLGDMLDLSVELISSRNRKIPPPHTHHNHRANRLLLVKDLLLYNTSHFDVLLVAVRAVRLFVKQAALVGVKLGALLGVKLGALLGVKQTALLGVKLGALLGVNQAELLGGAENVGDQMDATTSISDCTLTVAITVPGHLTESFSLIGSPPDPAGNQARKIARELSRETISRAIMPFSSSVPCQTPSKRSTNKSCGVAVVLQMSNLTREKCLDIINRFEPTSEARMNGQLLIDGFTKYLLSEECDIFDPIHREVCQDMRQPLTHYTVSASHNTYLLEDQLKGPSSVEGYIRALGNGCRCVKGELLLRTYHEQNNHRSDEVYPHLCGGRMEKLFVKTTLSTSNRDSNLKFPVIGSLIYCESSALGRAPTEMARVWCGGDVALVWRVV
uniref:Phosphoinositide phospholipase C n=1 Tax=Timema bartmani TaxID=61472 RepID=A0A7R9ET10_9NEOP|nr:unnamed protein product [Timema bartmani]